MSDFDYTVSFSSAKGEAAAFTEVLKGLGKVLLALEGTEKSLETGLTRLEKAFRQNAQQVWEATQAYQKQTDVETEAEKEARRLKDEQDRTHKSLRSWFETLTRGAGIWNTWNKAVRFAVDDIRLLQRAVTDVIAKMEKFGGAESRAQIGIETFAGGPEAIAALEKQAATLTRTYRTSRAQIKEAQTQFLKMGMEAPQVEQIMPTALTISKAEGLTAEDVGQRGLAAAAQFKEQGLQATDAILTMKAAADASQTSFERSSSTITAAARDLAPAKVAYRDIAIMTALAAERNIIGQKAGTSMSAAWRTMANGAKGYKDALKELGLTQDDMAKVYSRPMDLVALLEPKIKPLSADARVRILNKIFGAYGGTVMNAIVMQGVKAYDDMGREIDKKIAENTGGKQFGKQYKTWEDAISGVRVAGENLWSTLAKLGNTPLAEFFSGIEQVIFKVEARFQSLADEANKNGGTLQAWMDVIAKQGVKGIFKGLAADAGVEIDQIKSAFSTIATFVKNLAGEVWNTFVDENLVNAIAGKIKEILKALFTVENVQGGIDIGVELAAQIFEGIKQSGLWKWILAGIVLKVGIATSNVALKVFGDSLSQALAPVISGLLTESVMKSLQSAVVTTGAASLGIAIGAAMALAFNAAVNRYVGDQEKRDTESQVASIEEYMRYTSGKNLSPEASQQKANMESEYVKLTGRHSRWYQTEEEKQAVQQKVNEVAPTGAVTATQTQADAETARLQKITELAQREGISYKAAAQRVDQEQMGLPSNVVPFQPSNNFIHYKDRQGRQTVQRVGGEPPPFEASWVDPETGKRRTITSQAQFRDQQRAKWGERGARGLTARAMAGEGGTSDVTAMSDAQLEQEGALLKAKQDVIDAEKQHKQALEQSLNILVDSQKEINNVGAALKEWLVRPVDTFQQKLLEARERFGGMLDALSGKKVDLAEKFGLTTKEEAGKERKGLLEKQQERDQRLMELAQTPEEQARIAERMAGRQEKLAEMGGTEEEKQAAAKKGVEFYTQAERATEQAQADEERRLQIRRETAEKNLGQDEQAVGNAQTAGERAARLAALLSDYQNLGPKYREKAIEAEAEWEKAKKEADAEQARNIATTAKMSVLTVELLRRIADRAETGATNARMAALSQENADYQDQVVGM